MQLAPTKPARAQAAAGAEFLLANVGRIDPLSIDDYCARGGYRALKQALALTPDAIIEQVQVANLRGRGGGGYPCADKMRATRQGGTGRHYLICNADEGDPSVLKDSLLLARDPHSVLEGMLIAAWAIGADQGVIYLGGKHPECLAPLRQALRQARTKHYLGTSVCGTDFDFDVEIVVSDGRFVRGSSDAVVAGIERRAPEPSVHYGEHLAQHGLKGQPTLLNNAETLACLRWIITLGGAGFAALGSPGNGGTKLYTLTGCVVYPGVYEAPMGASIAELLASAGGLEPGTTLQAILLGGPGGNLLPPTALDYKLDYDLPKRVPASIHAGGLCLLDQSADLLEVIQRNLSFLMTESCGQCVPCREGLALLADLLERRRLGEGRSGDFALIRRTADMMCALSTCGLGAGAATSVLGLVNNFPEALRP